MSGTKSGCGSFLVFCLLLWAGYASAAMGGELARRSMTGCFDLWPPYTQANGTGITQQLVAQVARQSGLSVTLTQMPWKRCLAAVEQGAMTFALDAMPRQGYLASALPVTHVRSGVFAVLGRFSELPDLARQSEVLIGRPLGWSNWETVRDYMPAGPVYTVIQAGEADQMLDMLRHGRIDVYVDDVLSAHRLAARHGMRLTTLLILPGGTDLYVLFGVGHDSEKAQWDAAMEMLRSTGWLADHFRRHGMVQ